LPDTPQVFPSDWLPAALNQGHIYRDRVRPEDLPTSAVDTPLLVSAFYAARYRHSDRAVWSERLLAGEIWWNGQQLRADGPLGAGDRLQWHRPPWQEAAVPVLQQGAIVFVGHAEAWKDWNMPGLAGAEIVNLHAGAMSANPAAVIGSTLLLPARHMMRIVALRDDAVFAKWDEQLVARHPFTPVGGGDAHANIQAFGPLGGTIAGSVDFENSDESIASQVSELRSADADAVALPVQRLRAASGLPVAVGFGIRTPTRAAEVARVADAVVVGSALVDEVEGALNSGSNENVTERVLSKAAELAKAVRLARVRDA
jgi:hypothetical protein